jgi:predicted SnoaL-like aldol condensation-catalyzing enzyme
MSAEELFWRHSIRFSTGAIMRKRRKFWSETYIQHSAHIPPGRDGLFNLVRNLPDTLRYENTLILAEGDRVMLHGRFSGHGRPRAWIAADILRMEDGRLAEHWDVLQDEVTATESRSGLPMFGTSFAKPDHQRPPAAAASSLTVEEARRIVAPLYDALSAGAQTTADKTFAVLKISIIGRSPTWVTKNSRNSRL